MSGPGEAPELLVDLAGKATALAQQLFDVPKDVADAFGAELAQSMAADWGGQQLYFPKGSYYEVAKLHQDVWQSFNGHNINELVARFRISRVWVYKILARMRALDVESRQGNLFGRAA